MPERENDWTSLPAHSLDTRLAIDDADPPRPAEQPQERDAEAHDPAHPPRAASLRAKGVAPVGCGWREVGQPQLASRRSALPANSRAIVATRPEAPAVPNASRT